MMAYPNIVPGPVKMGLILEFESVFPSEKRLRPEEYLKGGSKSFVLKVSAFFLGFKANGSKFKDHHQMLRVLFSQENDEFAALVYDRIKALEDQGNSVTILKATSSLSLFEYFFNRPEEAETQTPAEFERNLFKAYLVMNSEFTERQRLAFESTKGLGVLGLMIPMMMFCMQYPSSDKENYDIKFVWATQAIKAIYLFQFLESNEKTKTLLIAFLARFSKQSWQEYFKSFSTLTLPAINSPNEAHTDISVAKDENFADNCKFLDKLIVQDQDALDKNDFLTLRARPIYKVEDGVYRIIFNLFIVEKLFKGIYFLLRDVNETLPEKDQIKQLKSFYGDEFSEKILAYKIFEIIYPVNCVKFSGKVLSQKKVVGGPDYYVRAGNDLLLVESKDFLIKAEDKMSFDYKVYEKEFKRVLYFEQTEDGKIKAKAVRQIANNIRVILKRELKADQDYDPIQVNIFPVLLTHDLQYDTPGFNDLLNSWFKIELESLRQEGLSTDHVQPLTCVNVDALIYHQTGLREKIPLHEVLKLYITHMKVDTSVTMKPGEEEQYKNYRLAKLTPFSLFIYNLFGDMGIRQPPPILELLKTSLFPLEKDSATE